MKTQRWKALAWFCFLPTIGTATEPEILPFGVRAQAQERIGEDFHLGTVIGVIDSSGRYFYGFGLRSLSGDSLRDTTV